MALIKRNDIDIDTLVIYTVYHDRYTHDRYTHDRYTYLAQSNPLTQITHVDYTSYSSFSWSKNKTSILILLDLPLIKRIAWTV